MENWASSSATKETGSRKFVSPAGTSARTESGPTAHTRPAAASTSRYGTSPSPRTAMLQPTNSRLTATRARPIYVTQLKTPSCTTRHAVPAACREISHATPHRTAKITAAAVTPTDRSQIGIKNVGSVAARIGEYAKGKVMVGTSQVQSSSRKGSLQHTSLSTSVPGRQVAM